MENSILILQEPNRSEALKALKEDIIQQPISKTDYMFQTLCSLYWLSPLGFLHDREKHKTCWELVSI